MTFTRIHPATSDPTPMRMHTAKNYSQAQRQRVSNRSRRRKPQYKVTGRSTTFPVGATMSLDNITLDGVSLASPAPCSSGKVQHKDKASAEAHALSIQQKDGHLPNVFVCAECGFFHVGGGRKSDRPAYLQPSRIPVLPPAKLPRKEYQRRKIEEGVSYEVRDVVVEYYQAHAAATDNDVAKHFGLSHDEVYAIRRAEGVGTKSQCSTAK